MTDHDPQAMRPALVPATPTTPSKAPSKTPVAPVGPPRMLQSFCEAIGVAAGAIVILVAPAIAVGLAAHAAAWCLRLGYLPQARALGAAVGLLAGLWTLVKLIYEGVLAPKRETPHDSLRSVGEHVVALAHRHALQQVQQNLSEVEPIGPPINARKPPGTH